MTWTEVAGRLAVARSYWLGSTTPSGAPHAAPVWGVVTGQTLYLYSERSTVKARNLAADPRVVLHLESAEDVLIVRGVVEDLGRPATVPSVVAALAAKYTRPQDRQYLPDADPDFDVVYALRPRSAMAWRLDDYEGSQRRWSADLWWRDHDRRTDGSRDGQRGTAGGGRLAAHRALLRGVPDAGPPGRAGCLGRADHGDHLSGLQATSRRMVVRLAATSSAMA